MPNININIDKIEKYLKKVKSLIKSKKFSVSRHNRAENNKFRRDFNLNNQKIGEMILKLKTCDFCSVEKNRNPGYEHELLYVFGPRIKLINVFGEEEEVLLYIKFNLIENKNMLIIVSFHQARYGMDYLFEEGEIIG